MKLYKRYAYQIFLKIFCEKKESNLIYNEKFQNEHIDVFLAKKVIILGWYGVSISDKIITIPFALKKTIIRILTENYNFLSVILEYLKNILNIQKNFYSKYHRLFYLVARHGRSIEKPNYAHWLLENLPMIYIYLKEQEKEKTFLLIRFRSPKWIYDSLLLLGVKRENIIETGNKIYCENLIYCSIPYVHSFNFIRSNFLRSWVASTHKKKIHYNNIKKNKVIFLSRQSSNRRKIKNFYEVEKVLMDHKIKIFDTEKLTIKDQIVLFSNTNCMITESGAAMANMIYMPKKSKVIEIVHEIFDKKTLWQALAEDMKHKHILYKPKNFTSVKANIIIDANDFDKFLKKIL